MLSKHSGLVGSANKVSIFVEASVVLLGVVDAFLHCVNAVLVVDALELWLLYYYHGEGVNVPLVQFINLEKIELGAH